MRVDRTRRSALSCVVDSTDERDRRRGEGRRRPAPAGPDHARRVPGRGRGRAEHDGGRCRQSGHGQRPAPDAGRDRLGGRGLPASRRLVLADRRASRRRAGSQSHVRRRRDRLRRRLRGGHGGLRNGRAGRRPSRPGHRGGAGPPGLARAARRLRRRLPAPRLLAGPHHRVRHGVRRRTSVRRRPHRLLVLASGLRGPDGPAPRRGRLRLAAAGAAVGVGPPGHAGLPGGDPRRRHRLPDRGGRVRDRQLGLVVGPDRRPGRGHRRLDRLGCAPRAPHRRPAAARRPAAQPVRARRQRRHAGRIDRDDRPRLLLRALRPFSRDVRLRRARRSPSPSDRSRSRSCSSREPCRCCAIGSASKARRSSDWA